MSSFKIGDKIRVKKLSKLEFKEIFNKKYCYNWTYDDYLNINGYYFNQIFDIIEINKYNIYCKNCVTAWFYKEEIEKVNYLKTKYKIIKELLKNE